MHESYLGKHNMFRASVFLGVVSLSSFGLYFLYFNFQPLSASAACEVRSFAPASSEISVPGASYLSASHLLARPLPATLEDNAAIWNATVPKIIHQSWKEDKLPAKFLTWSNSWRIRHPDWQWVLWTDEDNDQLIAQHWPMLNDTYWGLQGNIFRADFVRNLYMYTYGGMYADLDMECLRSIDTLIESEMDSLMTSHAPRSLSTSKHPIYQLALLGSMKTGPHQTGHSIPNAWMASTPGHPFWLLTISSAMAKMGVDEHGRLEGEGNNLQLGWLEKIGIVTDSTKQPEAVTGPVALREQVLVYQDWEKSQTEGPRRGDTQDLPRHPALKVDRTMEVRHGVKVLPPAVIYPFTWDPYIHPYSSLIYQKCRIQVKTEEMFDPAGCQDALNAYENGARAITYWSHSWSTTDTLEDVVQLVGT